ncbi:MAG TPA: serine/threonine-protein kinase [Patescibacteria group bacterium]|nr:serine/threonine-protein kinase [Patescibacteria group bacterium]
MSKHEFSDSHPPSDFKGYHAWEIHETRPKKYRDLVPKTPPVAEPDPKYVKLDGTARYLVEERPNLGTGGMSEVFKGWDRKLGKAVAIKRLDQDLVGNLEFDNTIELEAKTLTRISHPGIPEVYDLIFTKDKEERNIGIMIMQYIDGEDLRSWMENHKEFNLSDLLQVVAQTASTIDYMNSHGIVHRDIKPGNIMYAKPHVKIVDFGSSNWVLKTVAATPHYAPPEIFYNVADSRTDEFSLAATAYFLLSNRLYPDLDDNQPSDYIVTTIKDSMFNAKYKYQLSEKVCKRLIPILKKGLAYKPSERYQTSGEFAKVFCEVFKA